MSSKTRTRARAQARMADRAPTGTRARPGGQAPNARRKIAARRAADHRAAVRRRLLLAGGGVAVVIVLAVTLIVVKLGQSPAAQAPGAGVATTAQVQRQVTSVPMSTFDAAGAGTAAGLKTVTGQPALTAGGKPELLYMGGEYCPYCAAERWVLAAAVSRFGTLSGLSLIHSSPSDGNIPTLSFAKAAYTSRYLSFVPVEWFGEATDPGNPFGHVYLEHPTAQQQGLFARYAGSSIPFVDIGNRYFLPQVQYDFSTIASMNWAQIAAAMRDPSSATARNIDGAANMITAAICALTGGQPGGVCRSAGVVAAAGSI